MRNTCLNTIHEIAKSNEKILFIGSDLGPGTMSKMQTDFPERFFMEGISEQHVIGMASGLAMNGFIPYVNTIATFLTRRCYEQIALDICLHNLPVRLIGNGGGLVYAPLGPTHLALEDISLMRHLPNMTVISPCDSLQMAELVKKSVSWKQPIYFRVAKGGDKIITSDNHQIEIGKALLLKEPKDGIFITTGITAQIALEASNLLENDYNLKYGVAHFHTIKPLDQIALNSYLKLPKIITVEEHFVSGGLGSAVLEFANDNAPQTTSNIKRVGIEDAFTEGYGSQKFQLDNNGISTVALVKRALE